MDEPNSLLAMVTSYYSTPSLKVTIMFLICVVKEQDIILGSVNTQQLKKKKLLTIPEILSVSWTL